MKVKWTGGKGVNKDLLPTELELGMWSDANNVRFRNGFDEKMGGIAEILATPSITSYALFDYQTTSKRFVLEFGIGKAYCHDGTTRTQITRAVTPRTVSSIVDASGGTLRTLTTSTAHGLSTGDIVTVYGCGAPDADSYNEANAAITVTTSTAFTYSGGGGSTPSPATGSPAYLVVSGSPNDFTSSIDDKWTGGHLAGVFIANNPVDGLFYWNGDTATKLRPFEITTYVADVGRPFREWFVQLAPTISSTKYPRRVLWSAGAEPGSLPTSFVASASNDAGTFELDDTNGFCIDFMPLGEEAHIYKDDQRYAMQWIGGNEVFRFTPIHDASGLMARGCIANTTDGRQVFLTKSCDIRVHTGGQSQSIAEGRCRQYLLADIDSTYKSRAFLCQNPYTREIWIHYPRSGSSTCNGALVWNWVDNTWAIAHRGLNITAAMAGLLPTSISSERRMIVATSTPKIGLVDSGTTDFGSTITATLERTGIHFDEYGILKTLHCSKWNFDATAANTFSISHGYHRAPDAAATYATAVTYTQGTTRDVNRFTNSAEHCAIKITTTANDMKLRSGELEFTVDGEY